jgi:hypothetical protein
MLLYMLSASPLRLLITAQRLNAPYHRVLVREAEAILSTTYLLNTAAPFPFVNLVHSWQQYSMNGSAALKQAEELSARSFSSTDVSSVELVARARADFTSVGDILNTSSRFLRTKVPRSTRIMPGISRETSRNSKICRIKRSTPSLICAKMRMSRYVSGIG